MLQLISLTKTSLSRARKVHKLNNQSNQQVKKVCLSSLKIKSKQIYNTALNRSLSGEEDRVGT